MEVSACVRRWEDAHLFTGISPSLRLCQIPALEAGAALSGVLRNADAVIHLAGRVHVMQETAEDPLAEFRRVNVGCTESLAQAAAQCGVKRFIYLSSIKVNGEATAERAFEADDPPGYRDFYGQSKWEAEERLKHIAVANGMEWVVVRPPLVYGPGVRGNFISLMECVFRGIPLPFSSLQNRRSLIGVDNLTDLLTLLVDHPGAANNRFVACDAEDVSTPDLVRCIAASLHCSPRLFSCPERVLELAGTLFRRSAAVQRLCSSLVLDRRKTSERLGWKVPFSLDHGLNCTAECFLNNRGLS
jgi:nucleoside-diphosphate-sugar epimerase